MTIHPRSLDVIERFLAQNRIAIAGVSRDHTSFSVRLFDEFCRRGYDVVPVNPKAEEVEGRRCFAHVQDIQPPVDAVLLMTAPEATDQIVEDCVAAGIKWVWMYKAVGKGAVSEKAVEFCQQHGIEVIPGECPFMFFPHAGAIHGLHGFLRKIGGHYPRHANH